MVPQAHCGRPGLGFGKRKEQNAEVLARLPQMAKLDLPILVGPSRKSFLSQNLEMDAEFATAAAVTAAIFGGAHIVRVHNVKDLRITVQVADQILASIPQPEEPPPPRPPAVKRRFEGAGPTSRPIRPIPR